MEEERRADHDVDSGRSGRAGSTRREAAASWPDHESNRVPRKTMRETTATASRRAQAQHGHQDLRLDLKAEFKV
jgi:hypothetical protein